MFKIVSEFKSKADQKKSIDFLSKGIIENKKHQVLLGVTGSGKTFTMANIIAKCQRPSLVVAPNKTLAAQLYNEFKNFFPENAVEYFVSYYDYYQPEAYIPSSDTYIQKDSSINDVIDKMRHSATRSVLSRKDVIVVASVSCIYGLGAPEDYLDLRVTLKKGDKIKREELLKKLVEIQYTRGEIDFHRGTFRAKGDRVEIFPVHEEDEALRIDFWGDNIDELKTFDFITGHVVKKHDSYTIFPASHYVSTKQTRDNAIKSIKEELSKQIIFFRQNHKLIEAQRIEERVNFDLEMIQEIGYCNGIENYSIHLTGRKAGTHPPTLLEYFPKDFLIFLDESHLAVPQIGAMYKGDLSRKTSLVKYGFRLPSALDNRPLKFEEFEKNINQIVYVSATPAEYEYRLAGDNVTEQIVRPTGLLDPKIEIRPSKMQVDDLYGEINKRIEKKERVLVTTLSKRMSEDLSEYFLGLGLKVKYLHSEIKTMERMDIIEDLRRGNFDCLIGINLLREGLDIPEVSLVAILDADKEGFLRSEKSLMQTCGRAARNLNGKVIMYADRITAAMKKTIDETERRRKIQEDYNRQHKITPVGIKKKLSMVFEEFCLKSDDAQAEIKIEEVMEKDLGKSIKALEDEMKQYAKKLDFEMAAQIRDKIKILKNFDLMQL